MIKSPSLLIHPLTLITHVVNYASGGLETKKKRARRGRKAVDSDGKVDGEREMGEKVVKGSAFPNCADLISLRRRIKDKGQSSLSTGKVIRKQIKQRKIDVW